MFKQSVMALPCIVHLDLKGAPWKVDYLCQVISLMRDNGAWGVLIEWEDTFPYALELVDIGSLGTSNLEGLYSHAEVKQILQHIKYCGMEPIQLVQTIGHMEFVLKHDKYSHLRELSRSPAVLCPSRPGALKLVQAIIKQVLDIQPDAKYLHIGADEAWHMNNCALCTQISSTSTHGAAALFLSHTSSVAAHARALRPAITVLMWDDMMREMPPDVIKAYKLGDLVQPVVWDYNIKQHFRIDPLMWNRYSLVFPKIWAASAFKGANGSCQMECSAKRYASNQVAWRDEMNALKGEISFSGIILTGWSRFDHYATLCELLPAALPSLVSCLNMWSSPGGFTNESVVSEDLPLEQWPGHAARNAIMQMLSWRARALTYLHGDQVTTWLNPWQVQRGRASPLQAENIAHNAASLLSECECVWRALDGALVSLSTRRTADEALHTWLAPARDRLRALLDTAGEHAH